MRHPRRNCRGGAKILAGSRVCASSAHPLAARSHAWKPVSHRGDASPILRSPGARERGKPLAPAGASRRPAMIGETRSLNTHRTANAGIHAAVNSRAEHHAIQQRATAGACARAVDVAKCSASTKKSKRLNAAAKSLGIRRDQSLSVPLSGLVPAAKREPRTVPRTGPRTRPRIGPSARARKPLRVKGLGDRLAYPWVRSVPPSTFVDPSTPLR